MDGIADLVNQDNTSRIDIEVVSAEIADN